MRKTLSEGRALVEMATKKYTNDPAKAGQLADQKVLFNLSRYAVAPVHTRFDAVTFFVWDAEDVDPETNGPRIIRQSASVGLAVHGLR